MSNPGNLVLLVAMSLGLLSAVVTPQPPTKPSKVTSSCNYNFDEHDDELMLNLRNLLTDLNNKAFQFGSYSNSTGSGANKVYGQYYCRADIDANLCGQCVQQASLEDCITYFDQSPIVIWFDVCTLRFNNRSMAGILVLDDVVYSYNEAGHVNVMDTEKFGSVLNNTMGNITTTAAYHNGSLHFATGEGVLSDSEIVYCLVQCSPDLNATQCYTCLQAAYKYIIPLDGVPWVKFMAMYYPNCQLRYSNNGPFYWLPGGTPPRPPPSYPSPPPKLPHDTTPEGKKPKTASYYVLRAVIPLAAAGLLVIFAIAFCFFSRKRVLWNTTKPAAEDTTGIQTAECVQFDLKSIESATNSFSISKKLGEGGFGIVYQGTLNDGQSIAVKRLSKSSGQGIDEFKTEVAVLAKVQHKNLVQLLGFCVDGDERLLVYEFLSNLSLDRFLFDGARSIYLTWLIRHKIIQGIARGLNYLHEDLRVKIVHRDLKTSNVLLDDYLDPKITDFGMARLVKLDETAGNTLKVVGTYGYMSPEYALAGRYSTKSDVYSYGVIVLEILSGKKNSMFYDIAQSDGLQEHAWKVWHGGAIEQLMDPIMQKNYSKIEAERCLQIGLLCIQDDATVRPTMHEVLVMLNSNTVDLPPPSSPTYYNYSKNLSFGDETHGSTSKQHESGSSLSSTTFSAQRDLPGH